jgi:CubicO group peptidase (beta-lactamase class C family)
MAAGRLIAPSGSAPGVSLRLMPAAALDAALAVATRQVETGTVPWAVLGIAGAEGGVRVGAVPPHTGPRIGTNAVCLLASITKPIVATAVMRLAQEGRFPLTAPLSTWLPELDAAGLAPFTAWHVLTHTSGIHDVDLEALLRDGGDRTELIRRTIAAGQVTLPGSAFRYASFTFDLLAEAIERSLDRPFPEVLREAVLDPLGMVHTTLDLPTDAGLRAPIAVGGWDGARSPGHGAATDEHMVLAYASLRLAGGGLWSTVHDLLRFGRAMLRGGELDGARVLGRPFVDLMTREVTVNGLGAVPDRLLDDHYAMGWGKPGPASPASQLAFGHGGVSGTRLWVDPAYDLVFAYLTGQWGGAVEAIDAALAAAYGTYG